MEELEAPVLPAVPFRATLVPNAVSIRKSEDHTNMNVPKPTNASQ